MLQSQERDNKLMFLEMETKLYSNYVTKQRRIVEFKTVFSSGMRELTQHNVPPPALK